ncbi:hypothetical protein C6P46_002911 [Rhodotorula mucilaginosa]|uniref:RING-type domain-containing protein n=1 Tax=Rhodotorula mucilaginosa TaxID=5537 RepID=A0A9P7B7J6_RHOMI|nr:hypothetical protein C6P46_002911 [Rhodotorula mucilaginosa]TKA53337.1 hypothetical protein B0A53_04355 [Rhodotorula sp. CCFEE 5036]
MGLSDLFANATNALAPPPVPPKSEADLDRSKDEIVRRLTEELVQTRQMFDALERQIVLLEKHVANLQRKEAELNALRAEQAEQPVSASDVAHRYEQLSDLFTQLQDTLTCPVCYEPFGRGQAVSLQCGHTFCQTCYSEWEHRHVEAWKVSPQQGVYSGPECPECRTADVRRGRVRIYSLEEVVRLVERGKREIAAHPYTPVIQDAIHPITGPELLLQDHEHAAKHVGDANMDDDNNAPQLIATTATLPLSRTESYSTISNVDRDDPVVVDLAQTRDITLEDAEDPAAVAVAAPADASPEGDASRPLTVPAGDEASQHPGRTLSDTPISSAAASNSEDTISAPMPASPPPPGPGPASSDFAPSSTTDLPNSEASRLSLEETYLRERAAARARAREAELRLEAEVAARRAEEEEREAREAREQLLVERGRRPYAVEGAIRETP